MAVTLRTQQELVRSPVDAEQRPEVEARPPLAPGETARAAGACQPTAKTAADARAAARNDPGAQQLQWQLQQFDEPKEGGWFSDAVGVVKDNLPLPLPVNGRAVEMVGAGTAFVGGLVDDLTDEVEARREAHDGEGAAGVVQDVRSGVLVGAGEFASSALTGVGDLAQYAGRLAQGDVGTIGATVDTVRSVPAIVKTVAGAEAHYAGEVLSNGPARVLPGVEGFGDRLSEDHEDNPVVSAVNRAIADRRTEYAEDGVFAVTRDVTRGGLEIATAVLAPEQAVARFGATKATSVTKLVRTVDEAVDGAAAFRQPGFDAVSEIRKQPGTIVEVGGPTVDGYDIAPFPQLDRPVHTTNVQTTPLVDPQTGALIGYDTPPSVYTDATEMAFRDDSVGVMFASALPKSIRPDALAEAHRSLKPGGLLVWQRGAFEDVATMQRLGLEVMEFRPLSETQRVADIVVRKPLR